MSAKKNTFNIFLIIVFITLINTIQTYVLHIMKNFGDINFYELSTHIFGIFACLISLLSSILAWTIASKIRLKRFSKIIIAFLLSLFLFAILDSLFYVVQRLIIYKLFTSFNMLFGNFVFSTVIFHLYISGLSLAYFYFKESAKIFSNLTNTEREKEILQYKILLPHA